MTAGRKLLLIFVASPLLALVVLAIVAEIVLYLATAQMCRHSVTKESASPDGAYRAILVEGDCGATTSKATHVVIRSAEYGESVPISERELRESVLISQGELEAEFLWPSPNTLLVISHGNRRPGPNHIYAKKDRHGELRIKYRGLPDG